jgi:hypothetical protein
MYLPFVMEGVNIVQIVKFVTKEKDEVIVWCTTNRLVTFRDFMQYVLDSMDKPKDFMIVDMKKDFVYDMYKVATEIYGMRKRTFEERLNGTYTGKWLKYTNANLEMM